jgi:hypothetical protein|nr:NVEALA domain-containing protein [uncultured Butyricimonas sp.]
MKRILLLLVGCIVVGLVVMNLEFPTGKKNMNQLMLRNVEALAGDESGNNNTPCTVAGGFCYGDGMIYWGITLE